MSSSPVFNRVYTLEVPQSVMLEFRPLLLTSAPLTFSLVNLPPSPLPYAISTGVHVFIQCVIGGGGDRGPQTDKHLPPSIFTGQFLRKADIFRVWCLYRYLGWGKGGDSGERNTDCEGLFCQ